MYIRGSKQVRFTILFANICCTNKLIRMYLLVFHSHFSQTTLIHGLNSCFPNVRGPNTWSVCAELAFHSVLILSQNNISVFENVRFQCPQSLTSKSLAYPLSRVCAKGLLFFKTIFSEEYNNTGFSKSKVKVVGMSMRIIYHTQAYCIPFLSSIGYIYCEIFPAKLVRYPAHYWHLEEIRLSACLSVTLI